MSLFEKLFRPEKNKPSDEALANAKGFFYELRGYNPVFHDWRGQIYESELVRAAIDARARHISKLKVEIHGSARLSLKNKMLLAPNQWMTWAQFLYRVSTILDIHNTAFIVPVVDDDLNTTGYYPVLPERCEIIDYKGEPWLRYKFSHGDTAAVELRKCAILTKHQYRDDFFGERNNALDETMKLIHIQNEGIEEAVKNSATYRFYAKVNNFTKPEDLANERKRFSAENLTKDAEGGGILLFPNTYGEIHQIDQKTWTVDADQMKLIRENVFDYFGVNDEILRNSAKSDLLDGFFNGAIEPFAIQFSERMTMAIYSERERQAGNELLANANRLQYMTASEKVTLAQQMLDRGVMSINEARELLNYAPVEGGDLRTIRGEYKDASGIEETEGMNNATDDE